MCVIRDLLIPFVGVEYRTNCLFFLALSDFLNSNNPSCILDFLTCGWGSE